MRLRTLKPSFFRNEELAVLSAHHRLLFEGLWCLADREGRLEDRPRRIHADVFPYESKLNVEGMLNDLHRAGFIHRCAAHPVRIVTVINFEKHQHVHHTEAASVLPPCDHRESTVGSPLDTGESPSVLTVLTVPTVLTVLTGSGEHASGGSTPEPPRTRRGKAPQRLLSAWPYEDDRMTTRHLEAASKHLGLTDPADVYPIWDKFHAHALAKDVRNANWDFAWVQWVIGEKNGYGRRTAR
jgi:hypothetical protein